MPNETKKKSFHQLVEEGDIWISLGRKFLNFGAMIQKTGEPKAKNNYSGQVDS